MEVSSEVASHRSAVTTGTHESYRTTDREWFCLINFHWHVAHRRINYKSILRRALPGSGETPAGRIPECGNGRGVKGQKHQGQPQRT